MKRRFFGFLSVLTLIVLWEIVGRFGFLSQKTFPPPSEVFLTMVSLIKNGVLLRHFLRSLFRVLVGFTAGSISGIVLGVFIGWKDVLDAAFSPLISLFYPIPALGWLPLLMLWMGTGDLLPITIIFICSFFPVLYNTSSGVRNVGKDYIKVARTLGASGIRLLVHVVVPLSLPAIFTGLRLEAGMAWRVVIAAEMVAIPTGIGALMMKAENLVMVDVIMVCLAVLALMCFLFERLMVLAEKKLTGKWRSHALGGV